VKESEPMFIITLEGIDDQYFDKSKKEPGKESAKPNLAEQKSSKKPSRSSPDDGALELHPHESFDSPGQSPRRELEITKPKASKLINKTAGSGQQSKKQVAENKKQEKISAAVPPKKPTSAKSAVATTAADAKAVTKSPVVKSGTKAVAANRKVATVKPSVNKPEETKIIVRKPAQNPTQQKEATAEKPKPKFTPITAPKGDSPVSTVISLKPKFHPVTFSQPQYTVTPKASVNDICKYYPNCVRGSSCFYFHPSSPAEVLRFKTGSKFKWTAR